MSKKVTAAVIGSGFGGLALAIRLQAAGVQTDIFEKRDLPGGRAYVYKDEGFTFDAGPTVITAPQVFTELYGLAGRRLEDYVELMPVTPFYRLMWEDGFRFDYSNDLEATNRQIAAKSPADVAGYSRFLEYTTEVFHEGYTKLVHVPFLNWWSMVRVSPQLLRLESYRSVYSAVSKYVKDPHLRQAFSFHSLLLGGNPFSTPSIYTLVHHLERKWGVFFPRGGTGALVRGLVRYFEDLGGRVHLNAEVTEITTRDKRVTGLRLRHEEKARSFDLVASNADLVHTYSSLLSGEKSVASAARRFSRMSQSMSLFLIYFGVRKKYPALAHHNILFGPRYKGLLNDIFKTGQLSEDFSLYLHAPSISDPAMAPAGCECFYVLSPVPHLGKAARDWSVEGPRYAKRILDYLDARYLPGLKENLVTTRLFTPEDFKNELHAHHGAAFSLEPVLTQSAYFRAHNRDDFLTNMYIVGAGTHPGAGLPGVVNSAKATAGLILQDFGVTTPYGIDSDSRPTSGVIAQSKEQRALV